MGPSSQQIAVIDNNEGDYLLLREYLAFAGEDRYRFQHYPDIDCFAAYLAGGGQRPDVVLADCGDGGADTLAKLGDLVEQLPATPIIGMGGTLMGESARGAVETGISNFICKSDITAPRLAQTIIYACANERRLRGLFERAYHDSLTGLANRSLLFDRIGHALDRCLRSGDYTALLMIDLDGFKRINDSFGHDAGDAYLQRISKLLRETVRDSDTVARLGGDEFAILLEGLRHAESAIQIASKLLEATQTTLRIGSIEIQPSLSIGVSLFSPASSRFSAEWLSKAADTALYRAKAQGKNQYCVFTDELDQQMVDNLDLDHAIRRGLERSELLLHYQPIVSADSHDVVAMEALLRWQHPVHGLMAPARFIPALEKLGFMQQVGEFVLRQAVTQFASWQQHLSDDVDLHVNLSVAQLSGNGFSEYLAHEIDVAGVSPRNLCLELTESMLFDHSASVLHELAALEQLGVKFAIDDFGTGYGSFNYLKDFAIDSIKIDKRFVDALASDPTDRAIVRSMMGLACDLGVEVTAEGVESLEQVRQLRRLGDARLQGFLFHRPLPVDEMTRLARRGRSGAASPPERSMTTVWAATSPAPARTHRAPGLNSGTS